MPDAVIEIEDLNAHYGETQILYDINAEIYANEITVILGASGSGKTTLLRNMLKLNLPSSGLIRFFGKDILSMKEAEFNRVLKQLGMLFQHGALLESVDLTDNVGIPLRQHTNLSPEIISGIVKNKLELVGLRSSASAFPSELSGGMRKRAALARAIALDPVLLFCDEPASGLDPVTTLNMDNLLLDLREKLDITMVIVSHDIKSVLRTADRILFLHQGRLLYTGTPDSAKDSGIEELERYFSL
jgi:phospholipid/cholesterol/gamma-HCH transport system ATP-binding protein